MKESKQSHYPHPAGLALAFTAGIVYVACALLIVLWQAQALRLFSTWFHGIDMMALAKAPSLTLSTFIFGLASIMAASYIVGALYAWLYQKCEQHCIKRGWIK